MKLARRKVVATIPVGHTAQAPVVAPDGKTLFVCNQFDNDVTVIDLRQGDDVSQVGNLSTPHKTPPAMFLGVRTNAETAVRAGIEHILFTKQPEDVAASIDEYLKSLNPVPSPHLVHGKFSQSAKRGEKIFHSAGCADCHPPGLFTDQRPHDVGTRRAFDDPADKFYTPTLIEVWRTAPYLHDGSAPTMRDVLTTRNPNNEHGVTKGLSGQELDDLSEYVLSL
jgi:YVTN family beta-propeller protein